MVPGTQMCSETAELQTITDIKSLALVWLSTGQLLELQNAVFQSNN